MNNETNKKTVTALNHLIHLDIDAVGAYTKAIEEIDFTEAKERLTEFRADHERHIENLSLEVRNLGGTPPERKRDLKGLFIEGFTAIRSKTGTEGAMRAMKSNEELTNKKYEAALKENLTTSARDIVERNRADEARHLSYVVEMLQWKPWTGLKAAS